MARSGRREHLIHTAIALFSEHGFHATGVDMIMRASGVSKKTMYTYFRSKEELVLATLEVYDGIFRQHFVQAVENASSTPKGNLLAVFDVAQDWFSEDSFYGCMFINAVGEYATADNPIRKMSQLFKARMYSYMRQLCEDAGAMRPDTLAEELALLLEGAIVTAQVSRKIQAAETAKRIASKLIDNQIQA